MTRVHKYWTPEEFTYLRKHYADPNYPLDEMAARMGRNVQSLTDKAGKLGLRRRRVGRSKENAKRYVFKRAGVHYKTALPPEKWTTIQHFLGELNYYAGLAEKAGVEPNVSEFLAEWGGHNRGRRVAE